MAEGIDVSSYQDGLDWKKAATQVKYAWFKVSEGATWRDRTYACNQSAARAAGLSVGGYHWARPDNNPDPKVEADHFLAQLSFTPGDLRPALDFEEPKAKRLGAAFLERWALKWLERVEKELGVKPVLYINPNWLTNVLNGAAKVKAANVDIWLADYGPNDGKRHNAHSAARAFSVIAHQYTSQGRITGWGKPLDRNYARSLKALRHQPPAPKARPPWVAVIDGKPIKGTLVDAEFLVRIRETLRAGKPVTLRPRKAGE